MSAWTRDPRLGQLRRALSDMESPKASLAAAPGGRMEAAVALVLRPRPELDVLLIKRAVHERDPWSGHMALPGGRWEPGDPGLRHTAARETWEETGVDLRVDGVDLGKLDDVQPANPTLPIERIAPFAFAVPPETEAIVASHELESVHWVPIDLLAHPGTASTTRIHFSRFSKVFPSYHVVGEHVWGLTHRILTRFLEAYRETTWATPPERERSQER
ncbi:MAG: NUDIX hydrolase [Longimicrobiales bacterium]